MGAMTPQEAAAVALAFWLEKIRQAVAAEYAKRALELWQPR